MTIKVRAATEVDRGWVVDVAAKRMLEEEVGRPDFFNPEDCGRLFDMGVQSGVILIAEDDGEPVGCISGLFVPNMFNTQLIVLQEVFWYVLPANRNSRAGLMLLNAFCEIGKEVAHDVYMSLLDKSPVNQRILERRGFSFKEMAFQMRGKK